MAKNDDIRKEMEQLRHQLDALKQAQQESDNDTAEQDNNASAEVLDISSKTTSSTASVDTESTDELDLSSQFQELMEALNKEIKDTDPTTMLVVFSLGVLVGRLLPK